MRGQLAPEPQPGRSPVLRNLAPRHSESVRSLVERQAAEETKLDQLLARRIERTETFERVVQGENVMVGRLIRRNPAVERDATPRTATPGGRPAPGCIHENLTHGARGDAEEMRPALEIECRPAREPNVRLVHQSRRLECVPRTFMTELLCGETPQLRVHEPKKLVGLCGIGQIELTQNLCDPDSVRHTPRATPTPGTPPID